MPQHKDRRSTISRLSVWTTVFFYSVIILQLTQINSVESLTNSQHRMMAVIGHTQDITLPCSVDPPVDPVDEMVEWSRSDLNPRFVHLWRSGEDHLVEQNPSYKNRTSVSTEKLKTGDVSLKLTKVRLSDEGTYRCIIPRLKANFSVELVVEADIQITKISPEVLECKSKGWYPEPDVFWLDSEGKIISAGSTEILRGPDDLYVLSSRLTLEKGHSNNITCQIRQNNQHREAKIHVPDDFSVDSSTSARSTIAGLIAGIMFIILVAFLVWKWRKNNNETEKCPNDGESQNRSMNKMYSPGKDSEKQSLMKKDEEMSATAQFSTNPVSLCQKVVENENDISNTNLAPTTISGIQQNNSQSRRDLTNDACRYEDTNLDDGRQTHSEQFDNNAVGSDDTIPNQSQMDKSQQEQQPKQGEEPKSDANIKKDKMKTQTINDETAGLSPSGEESKPSNHSEVEDRKTCQQGNSKEIINTNGEKTLPGSEGSATNQNQVCSDVNKENASETPPKQPDSDGNHSETPTLQEKAVEEPEVKNGNGNNETRDLRLENTSQLAEEGRTNKGDGDKKSTLELDTLPSHSGAIETKQEQPDSKQSENTAIPDQSLIVGDQQQEQRNKKKTQTTNNETTDSANKDASQNDQVERENPNDDIKKGSKSTPSAQPSDPKGSTTNQEKPVSETQLNTGENQPGNSATRGQGAIGQQNEQPREPRDAASVPEDPRKDQNREKTQTTNNETTHSANKDTSQDNQAEGRKLKENTEKDSDSTPNAQPSDAEGSTTNQEQPDSGTRLNTEENQSGNTATTDQGSIGQQKEQPREPRDAASVPEDQIKDQNREKTQTTNNETTDSANKDVSQNDQVERGNPNDDIKKGSNLTPSAQPSDPKGSTTNQEQPDSGTRFNTEENQSENTATTDQGSIGQQKEQPREPRDGASVPEDQIKDQNEKKTQTTYNETTHSANKDTSQDDQAEGEESTEKDSNSKANAKPSDAEVSTTNDKKSGSKNEKNGGNKDLTSVEGNQSGNTITEDQSERQEQPRDKANSEDLLTGL